MKENQDLIKRECISWDPRAKGGVAGTETEEDTNDGSASEAEDMVATVRKALRKKMSTMSGGDEEEEVHFLLKDNFLLQKNYSLFELLSAKHEECCSIFDPFEEEEEMDKKFAVENDAKDFSPEKDSLATSVTEDIRETGEMSMENPTIASSSSSSKTSAAAVIKPTGIDLDSLGVEWKALVDAVKAQEMETVCQELEKHVASAEESKGDNAHDHLKTTFDVAKKLYGRVKHKPFNRILNQIPAKIKALEATTEDKEEESFLKYAAAQVVRAAIRTKLGNKDYVKRGELKDAIVSYSDDKLDKEVAFFLVDQCALWGVLGKEKRFFKLAKNKEKTADVADWDKKFFSKKYLEGLKSTASKKASKQKERREVKKGGKKLKRAKKNADSNVNVIRIKCPEP